MSKENLEQFMKPVAESKELQAKIGEEITGDALVALGATAGCGFSIDDVTDKAELSDAELEGVSGGVEVKSNPGFSNGYIGWTAKNRGGQFVLIRSDGRNTDSYEAWPVK